MSITWYKKEQFIFAIIQIYYNIFIILYEGGVFMNDIRVDQILRLISLKQEGAYWDFKKEWHSQKSDLLHDIMCFANNLVNLDCYIIIGVDEGNDYAICDIKADPNRKNTQKLVDFLKDKKFAGGVRPLTMVESCEIDGKIIDVIIIKNSFDTPYYLTESYKDVYKNNIYYESKQHYLLCG